VRPEGLEPPAYWFEANRSIQLSYGRTDTILSWAVLLPWPAGAETLCMHSGSIRWRRLLPIGVIVIVAAGAATLGMMLRGSTVPAGPPELVVEGFVQELARHHYTRAMPYLTEHMLAQTIPQTLEVRINDLERRTGRLQSVRGVPRWSTGNRAYAAVEIGTERADVITLGFGLSREAHDRWRIEELYDLGWKPTGLK
jgi:hypothetical protein